MTDFRIPAGESPAPGYAFGATRFVLVEPSHPGNVGAAARALKTMGFAHLVLVRPRVALVQQDATAVAMASGAQDVLAAARTVATLDEALAGTCWSLALSARPREYGPPLIAPRAAATQALARLGGARGNCKVDGDSGGEVALVFGNERVGLSNADVERCSAFAHIPADPGYSSLNLAQAVQVLAYELRLAYLEGAASVALAVHASADGSSGRSGERGAADRGINHPASGNAGGMARAEEIEGMFAHLEAALIALEFLDPHHPKRLMSRLRRLFGRTTLEHEEVNILRGIAKQTLLLHERVAQGPRAKPPV